VPDGDHDGLVARGYLSICLWPTEPVVRTRGSSGAAMSQMVGARAQVSCGGPGAASGQEVGAEATGTHGGPGAVLSWKAGAGAVGTRGSPQLGGGSRCLDLMLVRGVPSPQGTDRRLVRRLKIVWLRNMTRPYKPSLKV
jgi:hypothetical protein